MSPVPAVRVERDPVGVATLVIDRPPANAVDPGMIERFLELVPDLAADPDVRCIVIRGNARFFCAGADIAVMRDLSEGNQRRMRRWIDVQRQLELAPKPVIAAMAGHALGGGAELSLACDLRVLADTATFGFPEVALGLFPGAGGSQRLPRLVGPHVAKRLMIEGARLTAEQARALGLVDVVVAAAGFDEAVGRIAAEWAAKPTRAIGLLKRCVDEGSRLPIEQALQREEAAVHALTATADAAEGLQAFLDKRAATFTGR